MIITILVILNIAFILWIYLNLYKKDEQFELDIENIKDMDPLSISYINDEGFNNSYDTIIAEIINLNIKGYINIEYSNDKENKYDYIIKQNFDIDVDNVNEEELVLLNFLFPKETKITKSELEEKILTSFRAFDIQFNRIKDVVEEKLVKENIIDKKKKDTLKKITKISKRISILLILITLILKVTIMQSMSSLLLITFIIENVISNIMVKKATYFTSKGKNLKLRIKDYKEQIYNKEFLDNKTTIQEIVKDKEFCNSIALHINTNAKRSFINDKISQDAVDKSKRIIFQLIAIFVVIIALGLLLKGLISSISKMGRFWVFLIIAISVACVADVTKEISSPKK